MRAGLLIVVALLSIAGCARPGGTEVPKRFNAPAFAGLAGSADGPYPSARLDFALDTPNGGETLFSSCPQVEATDVDTIRVDQHSVFRLLHANCLALKRYGESRPARVSHLPLDLTAEVIGDLPVSALPSLPQEPTARRESGRLESSAEINAIEPLADGRVSVVTASEEIYYVPLAAADFDGDGLQDILLRLDWRMRDAFGKGVDVIQVTRRAPDAELQVTWRMGQQ